MRLPMNKCRGVNILYAFLTISFWLVSAFPIRRLNLLDEPEVHQLHPRMAAVIQCLQDIQQNVTAEHYYHRSVPDEYRRKPIPNPESRHRDFYRVYIDRPAFPGLQDPPEVYEETLERVKTCFKDVLRNGQVTMVFKTKEYRIEVDAYDDFSMETTHICGDREETALRGRDNTWVPYWKWCSCCVPYEDAEANYSKYREIAHLPTKEAKALWKEYIAGTPYDY